MTQGIKKISNSDFANFKEGSHKVFREVFDAYYQLIYNYAIKFCKYHEEAEEIVQEVFVLLFLNRDKIDDPEGIYPYLFVLTKRQTIAVFRKNVIHSKFDHHLRDSWCEESHASEQNLDAAELLRIWNAAIKGLPLKQQEIYELNKLEGLSYQDIADKIGISKNTVKNQLITASKAIKKIIRNVYYFF